MYLIAYRWKRTAKGIGIVGKKEMIKLLGRSPDDGDAVIQCWYAGYRNVSNAILSAFAPQKEKEDHHGQKTTDKNGITHITDGGLDIFRRVHKGRQSDLRHIEIDPFHFCKDLFYHIHRIGSRNRYGRYEESGRWRQSNAAEIGHYRCC